MHRLPGPCRIALLAVAALTLTSLGGCPFFPSPNPTPSGNPKPSGPLKPFTSENDLVSYFRSRATANQTRNTVALFGAVPTVAEAGAADNAGAAGGAANPPTAFSSTNLQEAGVDEADTFKTDGRYLYVARGEALHILDTRDAADSLDTLREVATLELGSPIQGIYLYGTQLIALSQDYGNGFGTPDLAFPAIEIWPPYFARATLAVKTIDVASPETPAVVHAAELDGTLVTSRLTPGRLTLVVTVMPDLAALSGGRGIQQVRIEQIMPSLRMNGQATDLVTWSNWLHPEQPDGYATTAIITLDPANVETRLGSIAVLANAGAIYASPEALYLTDTGWDEESNVARVTTSVHKFTFDTNGAPQYVATGEVTGRPINQFALSEHNGDLRIATQVEQFQLFRDAVGGSVGIGFGGISVANAGASEDSAGEVAPTEPDGVAPPENPDPDNTTSVAPTGPSSAVYVLREQNGELGIIGKVEGIEPGERMYAARFYGDRGFLVTFEQIDPLFTLDLSDPANPRVVGRLLIPGFSEYLHRVDENHLLGIGQATGIAPWGGTIRTGIQVSLFDISDAANPVAVQQVKIGGPGSMADVAYDHHAFALVNVNGGHVLALPALIYSEENASFAGIGQSFNGVVGLNVDPARGVSGRGMLPAVTEQNQWWGGWNSWRRVSIIGERIFAISDAGVQAGLLANFSATADKVEFPSLVEDWPVPLPADAGEGSGANGSAGVVGGTSPGRPG